MKKLTSSHGCKSNAKTAKITTVKSMKTAYAGVKKADSNKKREPSPAAHAAHREQRVGRDGEQHRYSERLSHSDTASDITERTHTASSQNVCR